MNKKYNYLELLSKLDPDQYRVYSICAINSSYFGSLIFLSISQESEVNSEIFSKTYFCEWLNQFVDENVTRLESEVIKWIYDYHGFLDFYTGDWSVDSLLNSVIQSWKNKPYSLRLNKLGMLYTNYIRFLGTAHGQDFLYGTTAYNILDYTDLAADDVPYYDDLEYRYQNVLLCKKEVVLDVANTSTEACEAIALWDSIFNNTGKYNLSKALAILKADPNMSRMSDMQMRRHLKVMQVKILESLLKNNRLEKYFDADYTIQMDGCNYTLRDALEYKLATEKSNLNIEYVKLTLGEMPKVINNHVNVKAFTRDEFKIAIENYCNTNNIICSFATGYYNCVARLKVDITGKKHKTYKLYIYNGGGYRDFSTDTTGYVTEFIDRSFFGL